ncbi:hypothetical protein [Prevotella micans]|uniref:hypothetical protein n=1 Tax=Prevotella micans TaxID=189723 RepID=UPI001B7FA27E|nr:hypothetical protein [Prevotella micans]
MTNTVGHGEIYSVETTNTIGHGGIYSVGTTNTVGHAGIYSVETTNTIGHAEIYGVGKGIIDVGMVLHINKTDITVVTTVLHVVKRVFIVVAPYPMPTRAFRPHVGTDPVSVRINANSVYRPHDIFGSIGPYIHPDLPNRADRHGVCPYVRAILARIGIRPRCDLPAEVWI